MYTQKSLWPSTGLRELQLSILYVCTHCQVPNASAMHAASVPYIFLDKSETCFLRFSLGLKQEQGNVLCNDDLSCFYEYNGKNSGIYKI